jgi:acetyl-CoA synthetase
MTAGISAEPGFGRQATEAFRDARNQLLSWRGDHRTAVSDFRWPELGDRFNWAVDWFDVIARGNEQPALVILEEADAAGGKSAESWSFDTLARRSDQVAAWLADQGVGKGDAVIVMLGNQVELWETMLGIIKLGAVIMPTTTAVGPADLRDRIERGGAGFVVANASDTAKFDDVPGDYGRLAVTRGGAPPEGWESLDDAYRLDVPPAEHPGTAPGDRLLLYFTSGTTSQPKLVEHTQVSYPVGHLTTMYWLGLEPGDVHLNISSPGWAKHAWSCFFAPWIAEATVFLYNYSRFDPPALLRVLRENEVTSLCAPPTVWRMLINADLSGGPGSLREIVGAGEPLNPEVIEQVNVAWGLQLRDGYGQTETTAQVGNVPGSPVKPGSMGQPLPGVPVVLVDPLTGERVLATEDGPGEGEICLDLTDRPLPLMTGYQGDDERNAEAMAGGYYHTGDVATVDSDGYITYVGRTDDVFKASDYKISPFELESVLIEHPAVAEAAVVPAPDAVRAAVPKAYIVLAPGNEPTEETALSILRYAREHLAPWQRVRRIEFAELPKTISGKIRRVELRGREDELAAGDGDAAPENEWRDDQFPQLRSGG